MKLFSAFRLHAPVSPALPSLQVISALSALIGFFIFLGAQNIFGETKNFNIEAIKPISQSIGAIQPMDENKNLSVKSSAIEELHLVPTLLSETKSLEAGKSFWVGLQMVLEPHWHIYWKNPGDAGLPLSIHWNLPEGFSAREIQWPYPRRISVPPLMNFGYEGDAFFLVQIIPPTKLKAGENIKIEAEAKWVVCNEICLPGKATVSVNLLSTKSDAKSENLDDKNAALFQNARDHLPITTTTWTFKGLADDSNVIIIATPFHAKSEEDKNLSDQIDLSGFYFFPDSIDIIENAAPQKFFKIPNDLSHNSSKSQSPSSANSASSFSYAIQIKRIPPDPESKTEIKIISGLVVSPTGWKINNERSEQALQIHIALEPMNAKVLALAKSAPLPSSASTVSPTVSPTVSSTASAPPTPSSGIAKFFLMLGMAFLGGLILNLMPCVLPVLSLKIFDFVKRSGDSRWKIFSHGLTFTAGVLFSFWILAGLLLILRSGGQQLGWGFQLQSPGFLIVLCALFFFFSLNLFGVFELGIIFTRIGSPKTKSGHASSFFAGITATVVATPCTAPFMGSAMGFAFSQPAYYAMAVFTFLGLGMAAPYLLLSAFPAMMRFLPKPGEWMEHFKQFMGFPLLATAIWLAWVLGHQAGVDALIALLFVLLLAGMSAWILGKWTALHRKTPTRIVAGLLALVIFVPAFLLVLIYLDQIRNVKPVKTTAYLSPSVDEKNSSEQLQSDEIIWENFSEEKLNSLIQAGKPIFIDFTADWCLSCKVNERVAFTSTDVIAKFHELNIQMLRADWTSRDEAIAKALAKYGRNSIPLYVLYGGHGANDFVLLPEVLTPGTVLDALKKINPLQTTMRSN